MHKWRRLRVLLSACRLVSPFIVYACLPSVVTLVLQHVLVQQGYQQVSIRLGYPGWHTWPVSYLHVQRELEHASLSVTVEGGLLHYDLTSLLRGRLQQITVPLVRVALHGRGSDPEQPCQPYHTAPTGPDLLSQLTAAHALQRLPVLPWQTLVLEQGHLFRECATGPLRDLRLSGTWHQQGTAFEGSVTFRGEESAAYRLQVTSASEETFQASVHAEAAPDQPIMTLQSHVRPVAAQIEMMGTGSLDLTRLPALLTLVIPPGIPVPSLAGSLQARWQGSVPAALPLATVWQHPETFISGALSLTSRLPQAAALGDTCALVAQGEVTGNAAQSTYRLGGTLRECAPLLAQEVTWDVQGTLAMEAQHIWGTLGAASSVQSSAVRLGDVGLRGGTLRLLEPLVFRASRASGAWAAGPARFDLQVPGLSWQQKAVLVTQASLSLDALYGDAAGWQLESTLTSSGHYEAVAVQDLSVRVKLQNSRATFSLPEPARLRIAAVQAGVQATDLALTIQPVWEPGTALAWVELGDLQATLLGGQIRSPGWRYTPGQFPQLLTVRVEQLDVQQLLQLEQQPHLEGTGRLDGVLPILLTPTGLQIQDGSLVARPPGGVLRYRPAPETDAAPALADSHLALVRQVLANFHYQVLTLGVHYREDGTLKLSAGLEGQNPDWQQGRPIHLNLTIQENIPALLESLQLIQGKGVEQAIQKHLQR